MNVADILTVIVHRLEANPPLAKLLKLHHALNFLELTTRFWSDIIDDEGVPPVALPSKVASFLSAALELPPDVITLAWVAFGDAAAVLQKEPIVDTVDDIVRLHGGDHGMGECFRVLVSHKTLRRRRCGAFQATDDSMPSPVLQCEGSWEDNRR